MAGAGRAAPYKRSSNGVQCLGSCRGVKRRYATQMIVRGAAFRGLKPTATVVTSLRDGCIVRGIGAVRRVHGLRSVG
jgi:hypothetical protein